MEFPEIAPGPASFSKRIKGLGQFGETPVGPEGPDLPQPGEMPPHLGTLQIDRFASPKSTSGIWLDFAHGTCHIAISLRMIAEIPFSRSVGYRERDRLDEKAVAAK